MRVRFRKKELDWFVVNSMRKLKKVYEKLIQIDTISNIRETLYSIFSALVCKSIKLPIFPIFGIFCNCFKFKILSNLRF